MKNRLLFGLVVLVMVGFGAVSGFSWPVPDTGQTKCYDDKGNEIDPCPSPGEPFYGQDGNYKINPPSYRKISQNGQDLPDSASEWLMVRDNVTGLIWEVKTDDGSIHDRDNVYTWCDSNPSTNGGAPGTPGDGTDTEDFLDGINLQAFGGYSDWRLPTPEEIQSIMDYSYIDPAIDHFFFPFLLQGQYWSSSPVAGDQDGAWLVD
jgi:hypothetical protein